MSRILKILCSYFTLLFLFSCSTSTKTSNALNTTSSILATGAAVQSGAVPVGGVPLGPHIKHQIEIKGVVICDEEMPNFKSLQVELWDNGRLSTLIPIDQNGIFEIIRQSKAGKHELRLTKKRNNSKILDKSEFQSDERNDRFMINLKAC